MTSLEGKVALVTGASRGIGAYGPFVDLEAELADEMMDVNAKGVINTAAATVPHLLARGTGDFVSVASEAGRRGLPFEAVYCASKFAQVGFTRALDHELRPQGIRCTNVCPGGVATDFAMEEGRGRTPEMPELAGMMSAEDVAEAVVFVLTRPRNHRILEVAFRPMTETSWGVTMSIRWGILSTADINRKVLAGAAESDDVEVVAVGSRDLERAQAFAERWGIPRAYGTYEELLAAPDVDAVYIPLPNTMHVEWSIRALEAGKHVLCEKPFSRHVEDVERAFAVAEETGKVLSEAFMYRYHPQTARLVELVRSGAIGELRVIRAAFSYSLFDTGNIRLRTDVEGGALMDVGCYCVSGARLLAGEPESVAGTAYTGPSGTDWVFAGMLRFAGDVVALFDCGTALPERDELEAIGTKGTLFLDDPWHCDDPVIELRRVVVGEDGEEMLEVETIEVEPADPYRLELEAMNAAIRGETGASLGRDDAVGQVRVIEALFRSAAAGTTVAL